MQDKGCREELGHGHGPGGGASGPAGKQLPVEDGQVVGGVAVMLRTGPQRSVGAETEESGGEAAPQQFQDGEFGGEARVGAQQGRGAIQGGSQVA